MYWDYERTSVPVGYTLQSNSSVLVYLQSMNLTLALSEDSSAEFEELFLVTERRDWRTSFASKNDTALAHG